MRTTYRAIVLGVFSILLLGGCTSGGLRPPHGKAPSRVVRMTVTGYCNCGQCCGWRYTWYGKPVHAYGPQKGKRKHVGVTASGSRARKGTLAADTSLYPFGTIMHIPGYGYGRVEDRGGAIKGNHVDAWFKSHQKAVQWGKQQLEVKVWLPK